MKKGVVQRVTQQWTPNSVHCDRQSVITYSEEETQDKPFSEATQLTREPSSDLSAHFLNRDSNKILRFYNILSEVRLSSQSRVQETLELP